MINYSKMMLASIKADMDEAAIEEENKRKRQEAIKAAINVARVLADKGVLHSMKHSVDAFGEHLGLTVVEPNEVLISIDIRDARTLDVLMQLLKTFYPEMSGLLDQAMRGEQ